MKLENQRWDFVYLFIQHSEAPLPSMDSTLLILGSWIKSESTGRGLGLDLSGTIWRQGFALIGVIMDSNDTKLFAAMNGLVEAFKSVSLEYLLSLGYLEREKLCVRDFFPVKPLISIVEIFPPHFLPKF
jgi:hypothetical protein